MRIVATVRLPAGTVLKVTAHAVDRYWERAVPACPDWRSARRHLVRLLTGHADLAARPPGWVLAHDHERSMGDWAGRWLLVSDDIAFPVVGNIVATCVCRGGISELTRQRRNQGRRSQPRRRRDGPDRREHSRRLGAYPQPELDPPEGPDAEDCRTDPRRHG